MEPEHWGVAMTDNLHAGDAVSGISPLDRRSARSRLALWQALLALLQNHDWAEINVQMICDRADVARSTFYAHYPAKQDLLDAGFALGAVEIGRRIMALPADPARLHTLDWLVGHVGSSQGFLRRGQGSPAGALIMARFRLMTTELLRRDLQRQAVSATDADLAFVIGGIFAGIDLWIAGGCAEPQAALIRRLRGQMDAVLRG